MPEDFEAMFRAMARELGESVERAMENMDVDDIAGFIGVDPDKARDWVGSAGAWLREQTENLGAEPDEHEHEHDDAVAERPVRAPEPSPRAFTAAEAGVFSTVAPHPLDLPTDEQGVALAALDSGRWAVEPGTEALASHGQGPGPADALGLVRELRVRDWLAADGTITLTGRKALARWLESGPASRAS
jgi:hypothetical protein